MTIPSWRDLSIVLLSLEAFVLLLIPGAALFMAIRGMGWILNRGRPALRDLQGWTSRVSVETEKVCARVVGPVVRARVLPARFKGLWAGIIDTDSRR